jgi:hypothetical protein
MRRNSSGKPSLAISFALERDPDVGPIQLRRQSPLCEQDRSSCRRGMVGHYGSGGDDRTGSYALQATERSCHDPGRSRQLMAHNARCSHAKSPPKDCKCSCGGLLHGGGGLISLGAGSWGRAADYNHNHRNTHLADSLDGQVVSVIDRILSSSVGDHADAATDRIAGRRSVGWGDITALRRMWWCGAG